VTGTSVSWVISPNTPGKAPERSAPPFLYSSRLLQIGMARCRKIEYRRRLENGDDHRQAAGYGLTEGHFARAAGRGWLGGQEAQERCAHHCRVPRGFDGGENRTDQQAGTAQNSPAMQIQLLRAPVPSRSPCQQAEKLAMNSGNNGGKAGNDDGAGERRPDRPNASASPEYRTPTLDFPGASSKSRPPLVIGQHRFHPGCDCRSKQLRISRHYRRPTARGRAD